MSFEFKLPDLGEGVHEGEVVRWLVQVGDEVERDQPVVEVMTDKVTTDLPSPVAGTVLRLGAAVGEVVPVGTVLIVIGSAGAEVAAAPAAPVTPAAPPIPAVPSVPSVAPVPSAPLAVPAVRRLARELGVDLETIRGTGPGGRVSAADVQSGEAPEPVPSVGGTKRIPLRGMRRVIAEHLLSSHRNTAPYTFVEEADFTELVRLRERVRPMAEKAGVSITYLPFILAAVSMALREHPVLNATVDPETGDLLIHDEQHLGVAVHTDEGLVVPVIQRVEKRNLLDLAREIDRLSHAARGGKLAREEVTGGTFSVTSLGILGGVMGTPMLNTPQVAVLGVHRIASRAVVRDGNVVPRSVANLSLTLDHRYIDGLIGARFAQTLVGYLEDPAVMLFWLSELRGGE
ncbi:MAG: catalytic domain of component of various dehydrogenase complexe [Armatimonadetes bacterium]|nr:catalytic domain of component of various dehydrogenase complexe [Armatimonadota bacterium]